MFINILFDGDILSQTAKNCQSQSPGVMASLQIDCLRHAAGETPRRSMKKCDSRHADLKPLRRATSPSGAVVPERSRFAAARRSSSRTSRIDLPWTDANLARASEGETPRCLTTSFAVIPEATFFLM